MKNVINVAIYLTATNLKLDSEFAIIDSEKFNVCDLLEVLREGFADTEGKYKVTCTPVKITRDELVQPANDFYLKKAKPITAILEKYGKKVSMDLPSWATFTWQDVINANC